MDLGLPIILFFACFQNYVRAKLANLNPVKWSVLTLISCMVTTFIGLIIISITIMVKNPELVQMMTTTPRDEMQEQMTSYIQNNGFVLQYIFVLVSGFGGYLLIRYLLDRKVATRA